MSSLAVFQTLCYKKKNIKIIGPRYQFSFDVIHKLIRSNHRNLLLNLPEIFRESVIVLKISPQVCYFCKNKNQSWSISGNAKNVFEKDFLKMYVISYNVIFSILSYIEIKNINLTYTMTCRVVDLLLSRSTSLAN